MGRSGSGKSTLLHLLGLLDSPTDGEIYLNGNNILKLSAEQQANFRLSQLGYVFQEFSLLTEMTIWEMFIFQLCASAGLINTPKGQGYSCNYRLRSMLEPLPI